MKLPIIKRLKKKIMGKYVGISIFPIVFLYGKYFESKTTINHETIHFKQQLEMLVIPFYLVYGFFFLLNFFKGFFKKDGGWNTSYYRIPFEQEAYDNEENLDYLKSRKPYAWIKYVGDNKIYSKQYLKLQEMLKKKR
jgi:hypothetical protein